MRSVWQCMSVFLLVCSGFAVTRAHEDTALPPGFETSIPRSAEADAKARLMRSPLLPMADSVHSYDVLFYRLNLYFPITTDSLSGTALIRCRSEEDNLTSVYLHLDHLSVDSVLVDGSAPLSWSLGAGRLTISFNTPYSYNDTFELLVGYGGAPYSGYYVTGSGRLRTGYTVTEPSDSRYWFPCWDEPWDKADCGCEIHAKVPLGYVVASNGLLTQVDTNYYASDTTVTYHWAESYAIPTYLMSVAIAQYAQIFDYYETGAGDTVEVRHFVYREDSSRALGNFGETPDMMTFFASIFGEYPFEKYGMACVTDFFGGMEHQTMTTILRSAARNGWEDGIAHELAHQWWGDMVTCFDWPEIWINEGFATYSETMWHEHKYGFDSFKQKITGYGNDYLYGGYTTYPLYDPPVLFSWSHVYTKGAWVLHMLRHMVGDSTYSEILQAFGERFKYGNASTEDLRQVVDSVTNSSFGYYFQQWIYSPEHPKYEYGWQLDHEGGEHYLLSLQIRQIQQHGPLFRMPVDLLLTCAGRDTLLTLGVDAAAFQEINVPLILPEGVTDSVLVFDPDNWVLEEHEEVSYVTVDLASAFPTENDVHVPVCADVSAVFNTDMDPGTIDGSTFIVYGRSSGFLDGLVTYDSLTRQATSVLVDDFDAGELVTVILTSNIESQDGIPLKNGYIYSFTTATGGGSATFGPDSVYAVDHCPRSVFAADLDGDRDLDLATSNDWAHNVSVLMNDGNGDFGLHLVIPVGDNPQAIVAADFDADGHLDMVTADSAADRVSVLVNNGDGTFSPGYTCPVGSGPTSVCAADLDGDGDLDLITANQGSSDVSLLLNDGYGMFVPAESTCAAGQKPRSVVAADFDGDHDLDLTTANPMSNDVSLLLNNGDGTFAQRLDYAAGLGPASVVAADLDGDNDLDLVTANHLSHDVSVLLNDGEGGFVVDSSYPVSEKPWSVVAADLDGDGDLDLAAASAVFDDVSVLLGTGNGIFTPDSAYSVGSSPRSVFVADIDADGRLDLITANYSSDNVSVLLNQAAYVCGDCNADGNVTIADATYLVSYIYRSGPGPAGEGDVNLDGKVSIADATYIVSFIYRSGPSPCQPPSHIGFLRTRHAMPETSK